MYKRLKYRVVELLKDDFIHLPPANLLVLFQVVPPVKGLFTSWTGMSSITMETSQVAAEVLFQIKCFLAMRANEYSL